MGAVLADMARGGGGPEEAGAEAHVRSWVLGQVNVRVLEAQAGQVSSEAAAPQLAQRRRACLLQVAAAFPFVLGDRARGGQVPQRVLDSLRSTL
jgi:uncharacterized protein YidB (DUF937 family)